MALLTAEQLAFLNTNGYLHVPGVMPITKCNAVINTIFEYLEMDPNDPEDWYRQPLMPGGMVELYQHQALWDCRQDETLYRVYTEILQTEKLWVSIDRVNFKPSAVPEHPEYDQALQIHWDSDSTAVPPPTGLQGAIALADTAEDQSPFVCVPEIYRDFDAWVQRQPADRNPRSPKLQGEEVIPIPAKAGDLIVWSQLLPHGNGRNTSSRPRFAQYITMQPAGSNEELRQRRIASWRDRTPPKGYAYFPGDPREKEQREGQTSELSSLGRRLLGLDFW